MCTRRSVRAGRASTGTETEKDWHVLQDCASIVLRREDDELIYVKGFALSPRLGVAFHYAWLTTGNGDAIDPTLRVDLHHHSYLGMTFSRVAVARLTLSRGYFGILDPVDEEVLAILR